MQLELKKHHIFYIIFGCIYFTLFAIFYHWRPKEKPKEIVENIDPALIPPQIGKELNLLKKDTTFTHYFDTLSYLYAAREYQPLWLDKLGDSLFVNTLQRISDSSVYDGLKPSHYKLDTIKILLSRAREKHKKDPYKALALADLYTSHFLVALWHDKVLGRSNPKEVLGQKYTLPYPNHPEFSLFAAMEADSGLYRLQHYMPAHPDYKRLKRMLHEAYAKTSGSETMIDTVGIRKLKPGDTTTIVPMLAKRLAELGLAPDSIIAEYQDRTIYDKHLAGYITAFQKTSNLTDDGIIGMSTLKILNASHNDRIEEIRSNMERIRWFGIEPPKPYVRVNLPEFMLYMYYPDSVKSMIVCIGKGKERYFDQKKKKYMESKNYLDKPMNHETPQVYSNIDYVILNPTWTVPSSIVGREMYNLIVRNPGYLTKNNYQVLKDGKVIDPYSINWKRLRPGNIPYTIRQNSGDDNSLGKIKFTFRNPFDVYMHDTPLKSKFKLNNRAVSHGCVRVQQPVDLAGFVLQGNKVVTYDDVLIKMGLPPTDTARARKWSEDTTSYKKIVRGTYPVRLENKMVVFFDYRTIVFDEFEVPRFIFDVYDKNSLIIEAINKP